MNTGIKNEQAIFVAAVGKVPPEQWEAYARQACAGDERLLARVRQLLRAHAEAGSFMDAPAPELYATADAPPLCEGPGTLIGPYKLLEQIGEGGFGVVFMAEQTQPVRRKVALKVVKPGMDTRQVVARFEAERQALALMDHPNIARVFDGGTTASGRPYFVMELVRGVPVTDFCDRDRLGVRERLGLFVDVCSAVQHAHQKGIIHRDLKPSNVLVTRHDDRAVVKVIDFGVAKATGQQLTDKTLFTNFAQMIGTPLYMSPEQAQMSGLDVDTRSDVYALGVLLYELLTGTTPFDQERLRTAGYDEIRRIIREEEPPRPSTRLSTRGQDGATVTANREGDPRGLSQLCRGELDWIVMKAMEKDRNRRYESASAFAADVRRYLNDEPVLACPPSRWYKFRKFARRNRGALLSASAGVLVLLLALIGLAVSNVLIRQAHGRARDAKDQAEAAKKLAEQRAEQIDDELERLTSANALMDRSRIYAAEMRWDDAHASLKKAVELRSDHASAWAELADLDARLGLWELAESAFGHELEKRPPDTPSRWYFHALLRQFLGDTDGYRRVCRRMRERFRGTPTPISLIELVRASVLNPGLDADVENWVELARNAVAYRPKGDWYALYALGLAHYRAGQHEQAVRRLRESLAADQMEWSVRNLSYAGLAMAHHRLGQTAEARDALKAAARALDHWTEEMYRHPGDTHWVFHLGATAYWPVMWWDWLEGHLYYREAKLLIDGSAPPDDPRVHVLRARAFAGLRWHDKADAEYAAALQRLPDDPQIRMEAHRNRGYGCIQPGQWKRAAAEFDQASELQPNEVLLGLFRAVAHLKAGDTDAYRRACDDLVQRFEKTEDPRIADDVLRACVLRPDALPDMARLLPLARVASPPPNDFGSPEACAALYRAGKYVEAVGCFEKAAKVYQLRPAARLFLAMARRRLGQTAEARQALAEAVRWIGEADREQMDDISACRPAWGAWYEKLECEVLLAEARKLLE
jgi:serine/threonine protein kinase/Flp pilus assembly protein TadD